jgi:hypothetical protein
LGADLVGGCRFSQRYGGRAVCFGLGGGRRVLGLALRGRVLLGFPGGGLVGVDALQGAVEPAEGGAESVDGHYAVEFGSESDGGAAGVRSPSVGVDAGPAEGVGEGSDVALPGEWGEVLG